MSGMDTRSSVKKAVDKIIEENELLHHIHGLYKKYVEELKQEIESLKRVRDGN